MNTNDESVLNMYLKEINKIPLLTHDEENELAVKAAAGDRNTASSQPHRIMGKVSQL